MSIDKKSLGELFSPFGFGEGWELTTTSFAKYMPIIEKKLGRHKKMFI